MGCYSLVNNFAVKETSLPSGPEIEHVARVTPLPKNQLQFQPGDVLGFYVESQGTGDVLSDNGVVLLTHANYSRELVWFASIDITAVQPPSLAAAPTQLEPMVSSVHQRMLDLSSQYPWQPIPVFQVYQ